MKTFHTLFFIGRMQPIHKGHLHVITEAAKLADNVVILVGSANLSRSPLNPFTYGERKTLINDSIDEANLRNSTGANFFICPLNDSPYNDDLWLQDAQKTFKPFIDAAAADHGRPVGLAGFSKDKSTYYLKMFPDLESVTINPDAGLWNATDIRDAWFKDHLQFIPDEDKAGIPSATRDFLLRFIKDAHQTFSWLQDEWKFYREYDPSKFPIQINCVDPVVVQSGHVLLVERKYAPGKGLLALPGGHVEKDEAFIDAVVRELKEETDIRDNFGPIPAGTLKRYIHTKELFDSPKRSQRGRVISMGYLFVFPNRSPLYKVKGMDDANKANWVKLGDLKPQSLFEDHYFIIQTLIGRTQNQS